MIREGRELLPIFHPTRHGCEVRELRWVRLQKAYGGGVVALGPWIDAYALRQRLTFRLIGVERAVKQDDARRGRPQDEGSFRLRCFLARPDKNIFAALALV